MFPTHEYKTTIHKYLDILRLKRNIFSILCHCVPPPALVFLWCARCCWYCCRRLSIWKFCGIKMIKWRDQKLCVVHSLLSCCNLHQDGWTSEELCILTSERVLHTLFSSQNNFFQHFHIFFPPANGKRRSARKRWK